MSHQLSYRADIDGLRAIAVLAVIASHLPEKFLPSGFLGVGFLARRVKRLLPALAVCVAVSGFVVLATDPFPRQLFVSG